MTVTTGRTTESLSTGLDAELDRLLGNLPPGPVPRRNPAPVASPLCLCWPDETEE